MIHFKFINDSILITNLLIITMIKTNFFFSSRRRHTRCGRDWSSDVCSSDLRGESATGPGPRPVRGSEGEILLHVREDRLQTGAVHLARSAASGPRALRVSGERFRGPRGTVAAVDADAAGTSAAHTRHGVFRD